MRWFLFVPVAILCSIGVRFWLRVFFNQGFSGSPQPAAIAGDIFLGAAVFVWVSAIVAPTNRPRAAITLATVYGVLFLLVELFRPPLEIEPLPHIVRLAVAVVGALCGLFLARTHIKKRALAKTRIAV